MNSCGTGILRLRSVQVLPVPLIQIKCTINVSGMLSNHKLAQAIADCGFHEFKRQLEYTAYFIPVRYKLKS
jgi:hypothetical protein